MMTCETCGEVVRAILEGVNVHAERGHLWHATCARVAFVDGVPKLAEFPSRGKLIRNTLMAGES